MKKSDLTVVVGDFDRKKSGEIGENDRIVSKFMSSLYLKSKYSSQDGLCPENYMSHSI